VTGQRLREVVLLKPISNGALNARLLSVLGNSLEQLRGAIDSRHPIRASWQAEPR
jgi:hypothetical protein